MAFAAWSFANFGQMVKQRVGERDWFVQHPNAFQKSAHLNFYCLVGFAALLFLAAMLMIFAPDSAMGSCCTLVAELMLNEAPELFKGGAFLITKTS